LFREGEAPLEETEFPGEEDQCFCRYILEILFTNCN
jgi:hypothetical protein